MTYGFFNLYRLMDPFRDEKSSDVFPGNEPFSSSAPGHAEEVRSYLPPGLLVLRLTLDVKNPCWALPLNRRVLALYSNTVFVRFFLTITLDFNGFSPTTITELYVARGAVGVWRWQGCAVRSRTRPPGGVSVGRGRQSYRGKHWHQFASAASASSINKHHQSVAAGVRICAFAILL